MRGTVGQALIDEIRDNKIQMDIITAVRMLPPEQALIVAGSIVAGLSQRQLAQQLRVRQQTVSDRMSRATDNIISLMGESIPHK